MVLVLSVLIVCLQSAMDLWVGNSTDLTWAAPGVGHLLALGCSRTALIRIIKFSSTWSVMLDQATLDVFIRDNDGIPRESKSAEALKLTTGTPSFSCHSMAT